jgi:hypothetical protein
MQYRRGVDELNNIDLLKGVVHVEQTAVSSKIVNVEYPTGNIGY